MRNNWSKCLGLIFIWMLVACGSSQKEEMQTRLAEARKKLNNIKAQASATDNIAQSLIVDNERKLVIVGDLIIESDYKKSDLMLKEVDSDLRQFLSGGKNSVDNVRLRKHGLVDYRPNGGDAYQSLTGKENPRDLAALKTGVRAGVRLNMPRGSKLTLVSETEINIRAYRNRGTALNLVLLRGTLQLDVVADSGKVLVEMEGVKLEAESPIKMEIAHQNLTGTRYICVYQGKVQWEADQLKGDLIDLEGLKWTSDSHPESLLPLSPRLEYPEKKAVFFAGEDPKASTEFHWFSPSLISSFQLQISDNPYFFTRVYDRSNLTDLELKLDLPPGEYHWRVRGFSKDRLPGPYSGIKSFVVARGAGLQAERKKPSQRVLGKSGPPITNVKFEIFKPTVVISGRTSKGARIRVNGEGAVLMDDGSFRSVINMSVPGKQLLRIEAANLETGAISVWEKEIVIP